MSVLQWPSIRLNQHLKWRPEPQNTTATCTMKCRTEPEMDTAHAASPQMSFTFVSDIYINDTQDRTRLCSRGCTLLIHAVDLQNWDGWFLRCIFNGKCSSTQTWLLRIHHIQVTMFTSIWYQLLTVWQIGPFCTECVTSTGEVWGQTRQSGSCILLLRWMHFVGNDKMRFLYFHSLNFSIIFASICH